MRHRGHGGGLHQRGRVLDGAGNAHHVRPPCLVGAGGRNGGGCIGAGIGGAGLDGELGDGTPVLGRLRRCRRLRGVASGSGFGDRVAEQVAAGSGGGPDGLRLDGQPGRDGGDDGIEQRGGVLRAGPGIELDAGRLAAVEDGEPGVEAGAAPGIGASVDRHREDDAGVSCQSREGVAPGGIAGHAIRRGDGGEPPAIRQHGEGRAEMAQIGVVADAGDTRRRGEWRVHQDDGRPDVGQMVGDVLGVVAGDRGIGEELAQEPGADVRDFVEMERAGGPVAERALGHDGQHAGAGRGFEDDIARADGGGAERGIGEGERGRELLEADLVLGALRVGGLQCGDRGQHGEHMAGALRPGAGLSAHGAPVTLHEQHRGSLGGLVGVLPDPAAVGIAGAEGPGHGVADGGGVKRPAGFEHREQGPGGGEQGAARGRRGMCRRRDGRHGLGGMRARGCVRRLGGVEHGVLRIGIG